MNMKTDFVTPVGRLVQGSLYEPNTTDADGKPLIIKTGLDAGKPRIDYYVGIAIPKGAEQDWKLTSWGQIIAAVGYAAFPAQSQYPGFAWKIIDGDSQVPNKKGRKPCDKEGFPGHWVINLSGGFAPKITNADGSAFINDVGAVKLGYYVQTHVMVRGNTGPNPGVYLNFDYVALAGYGPEIIVGADPATLGFGQNAQLPVGASPVPLAAASFTPINPAPTFVPPITPQTAPLVPPPNPAILVVPPIPAPTLARAMSAKAGGASYDSLIAIGWTDALLAQHGMFA